MNEGASIKQFLAFIHRIALSSANSETVSEPLVGRYDFLVYAVTMYRSYPLAETVSSGSGCMGLVGFRGRIAGFFNANSFCGLLMLQTAKLSWPESRPCYVSVFEVRPHSRDWNRANRYL